jgi:MBG domain (YGX type)/Putative Ig domain
MRGAHAWLGAGAVVWMRGGAQAVRRETRMGRRRRAAGRLLGLAGAAAGGIVMAMLGLLASPSASAAGGPFTCASPEDFLLANPYVWQAAEPATPATPGYTRLTATAEAMNALGFDPATGYLYAIAEGSSDLLRIDSAGGITSLGPVSGLPAPAGSDFYSTGAFDPAGNFWVTLGQGEGAEAYEINVTGSPAASPVAMTGVWGPSDWTYASGYFWALDGGAIWRFDPASGMVTQASGAGNGTNNDFEAAWTRADGTLAFYTENGAFIDIFSITDAATSAVSYDSQYSSGVSSSEGADGASCAEAEITTASLPSGAVGQSYSATVTAEGGPTPADYSWALGSGSGPLPPGLSLDPSSGTISGTPTTAGTYSFTVQVTANGAFPATTQQSYTVTIAQPLAIGTSSLPDGGYGQPYSTTLSASGGTGPYTWSVSSGSLPPGLSLDPSSGMISGTAAAAGSYQFTVEVTDASTPQQTTTQQFTLAVDPAPLTITASGGSMTYGGSPPVITPGYSGFVNGDDASSLSTPPACSTAATSASSVGTYPSTCSGAADPNYAIGYVAGTVTVTQAATTLTYTGAQTISAGAALIPSATLASPAGACPVGQTISFSLNTNPLTGAAGPYNLGSAATNASGTATGASVSTAGWQAGAYTVTAAYAGTSNCAMSTATSPLTVTTPGLAAAGAGTYPVTGAGTVKLGFIVALIPHTTKYAGTISLVSGGWWLNGSLTGFTKSSSTQGTATGTGSLYWWNQTLNHGRGGWQLAKSGVAFTASFAATSKTSPGAFGIQIGYTPVSPQPTPLPNSALTTLKTGAIAVA